MKDNIIRLVLQRMAQGYQEQIFLYENMYKLALEQEKCLQASDIDTEQLLDTINQRQELINSLESMHLEMGGLREEIVSMLGIQEFALSSIAQRCNDPAVSQLVEIMEKLTGLLARIKDLDKNNEEVLRCRIQETADRLNHFQQGKKARKAYQPQMVNKDGIFVDFSK